MHTFLFSMSLLDNAYVCNDRDQYIWVTPSLHYAHFLPIWYRFEINMFIYTFSNFMYQTLILFYLRLLWPHLSLIPTSIQVLTVRAPTSYTELWYTLLTCTLRISNQKRLNSISDTQFYISRRKNLFDLFQLSSSEIVNYRLASTVWQDFWGFHIFTIAGREIGWRESIVSW